MEELFLVIRGFPRLWAAVIPILLAGYYVLLTDASSGSKSIVAVLLILSIVTLFVLPSYWLWALLVQVALGIYVVLYLAWNRE